MPSISVPIDGALELRATLGPLHGTFAADGWWLAARTPEGPGTLRIRRTESRLQGDAWGKGAEWMLARAGDIAGLGDHPDDFQPDDSLMAGLHRRRPGLRFGRTGLVFDALIRAVCAQKVTGREASAAVRGLYRSFSDPAPGPGRLRLPPDPERIAAAPYYLFHDLHLEKRRADTLRAVARQSAGISELAACGAAAAAGSLAAIPGIGPWTIAETLAVSHGDPDQVPVGDFHIKHLVAHHLAGKPRGTDQEMLGLLEPYRPHRGRVIRLLHGLGHAPKYGPRLAPRDITRR